LNESKNQEGRTWIGLMWLRIGTSGGNKQEGGDFEWSYVAQGSDKWRAIINTVMKLRVSQNADNFLTS
jgi:hypothetical protein